MQNKYIRPAILMLLLISGYFIYYKYFSLRAEADNVLKEMINGEILSAPTINRVVVPNSTDDLVDDYLIKNKMTFSYDAVQSNETIFFQPVRSILDYSYIGRLSSEDSLFHCSYQNTIESMQDLLKKLGYVFNNESNAWVKKEKNEKETFFYRVVTSFGVKKVSLIFLRPSTSSDWKIAAILQEDI